MEIITILILQVCVEDEIIYVKVLYDTEKYCVSVRPDGDHNEGFYFLLYNVHRYPYKLCLNLQFSQCLTFIQVLESTCTPGFTIMY